MKIDRKFTKAGQDAYAELDFVTTASEIRNPDGTVVFRLDEVEVPASWSQVASDVIAQKYFRKAGVPQTNEDGTPQLDDDGQSVTGSEHSARQVIHRLVGCWRSWGESHGYFDTPEDAEAFYDELCWMMLNQVSAPNSPQWFNTGLNWAYGISGPAQGHFVTDPETGNVSQADDAVMDI